ncbi:hypothetical protein BRADI_3g37493v3 [Brachypodium distachyon]|uniref:Uncharacterized protein n=1 Tax=Brachypodium distachyon TaxID=15368 RepID=A0A2K2D1S6_BRADI|nr:hypothetical protein BRADI_3g37493v3 [Brachypodium distachyon]
MRRTKRKEKKRRCKDSCISTTEHQQRRCPGQRPVDVDPDRLNPGSPGVSPHLLPDQPEFAYNTSMAASTYRSRWLFPISKSQ